MSMSQSLRSSMAAFTFALSSSTLGNMLLRDFSLADYRTRHVILG